MGLETVTYISDLVATNPVGATDQKAQGDDHLRAIKTGLLNSFGAFVGAAVTLTEAQINDAALKSASQTISGAWTFTANTIEQKADPVFALRDTSGGASDMTAYLSFQDAASTERGYIGFGAGTTLMTLVNNIGQLTLTASGEIELNATTLDFNGSVDISGVLTLAAGGSASAPEFAFSGDTDTGIYQNGANALAIATAGALRASFGAGTIQFETTTLDVNASADISGTLACGSLTVRAATALIGIVGSGTGGHVRALSDAGDQSWLYGILGSASATAWSLYDLQNSVEVINVTRSATPTITFTAQLATPNTYANEVGYKGLPKNAQADNYTLVLTDAGKLIVETGISKTVTIPANASVAFPIGTAITFCATDSGGCSIAITTDTLVLGGTSTTGTRTLAANGLATAVKIDSGIWVISGVGLT